GDVRRGGEPVPRAVGRRGRVGAVGAVHGKPTGLFRAARGESRGEAGGNGRGSESIVRGRVSARHQRAKEAGQDRIRESSAASDGVDQAETETIGLIKL